MKLLMTYSTRISYKTQIKNLETAIDVEEAEQLENILVAFIHAEAQDEKDFNETEKKLVKNLKWGARKNETKRILLHSFAHLSSSKASAEFTKEIIDAAQKRLKYTDFEVFQTPFGYFLDLSIDMPGYSQARIFREFNRQNCDGENNQNDDE